MIGADKLWGPTLATAGSGMKIGIIDDGIDATHPYFSPTGFTYPPGFPKGQHRVHDAEGDRAARVRARRRRRGSTPTRPFDPTQSFHATHVAGIAAGDHGTTDGSALISGIAPSAYLGNYKALTIPTPDFGLDGNSAEIAAAIEAAVADGMNVINLSLGEPEIEPSRDIVVQAIDAAAKAGVVPVDRRRQRLQPVRLRLDQLAGERARRDHRRRDDRDRHDRRLLLGRARLRSRCCSSPT